MGGGKEATNQPVSQVRNGREQRVTVAAVDRQRWALRAITADVVGWANKC